MDFYGPWRLVTEHLSGEESWVMGRFSEREPRFRGRYLLHWLWGDAYDGTFFVVPWTDDERRACGNIAFLPTADEAASYARARAGGHTDVSAMERILIERNDAARAAMDILRGRR
jgi:hypothetical protein